MSNLQAVITHNPFQPYEGQVLVPIKPQQTLAEIIFNDLRVDKTKAFIVLHNGQVILRGDNLQHWQRIRPRSGVIEVRYLPAGGGGGGGSNPLAAVLTIALIAFAPMMAGALGGMMGMGSFGVAALKAGIMMVGGAIIQSVGPQPQPANQGVVDLKAASPTYSLSANGNMMRLGQSIPVVYGTMRVYPDFAAMPYAWFDSADDQYLLQCFVVSYGRRFISLPQLDDSSLLSFEGAVWGAAHFDLNGNRTWLNYSHDIATCESQFPLSGARVVTASEVSGQELMYDWVGGFAVCPAGMTVTDIEYDIFCPNGLGWTKDDASLDKTYIDYMIQYRRISDDGTALSDWVAASGYKDVMQTASKEGNLSPNHGTTTDGYPYPLRGTTRVDLGVKGVAKVVVKPKVRSTAGVWGGASTCIINSYQLETNGSTDAVLVDVTSTQYSMADVTLFNSAFIVEYTYSTRSASTTPQISAATDHPIRRSYRFAVPAARYEVRMRRSSSKIDDRRALHDLNWGGLKGVLAAVPQWRDVTICYVKLKAVAGLSTSTTRKFNCIAEAKLGAAFVMSINAIPQTPAIAIWDALTKWYGGKLTEAQIDQTSLYQLHSYCVSRGWTFDAVIDNQQSLGDVIRKMAATGMAEFVQQGEVLRFIIDRPRTVSVMAFRPDNIVRGTLNLTYIQPTQDLVTDICAVYRDRTTWRDKTIPEYDPNQKTATIEAFGVTQRQHALDITAYHANKNRYRRQQIQFSTELEGMLPIKGDMISITHDLLVDSEVFTVSRIVLPAQVGLSGNFVLVDLQEGIPPVSEGYTHLALRKAEGGQTEAVPYLRQAVVLNGLTLFLIKIPKPYPSPDADARILVGEPVILGRTQVLSRKAIVDSVTPQGNGQVQIVAWGEDERVYNTSKFVEPPIWSSLVNYAIRADGGVNVTWGAMTDAVLYQLRITFYPNTNNIQDAYDVVSNLQLDASQRSYSTPAVKQSGFYIIEVVGVASDGGSVSKIVETSIFTYVPPPTSIQWAYYNAELKEYVTIGYTAWGGVIGYEVVWERLSNVKYYDYSFDAYVDIGSTNVRELIKYGSIAQPTTGYPRFFVPKVGVLPDGRRYEINGEITAGVTAVNDYTRSSKSAITYS